MVGNSKRVHHVVWCVEPESLPRVRDLWQEGLGVDLHEVDLPEHGVVVLISWAGGVEVIAPVHAEGALADAARAFLAEHGEGVFSVVYAVDDVDAAVERVLAIGGELVFRDDITPEQFEERQVGGPGAPPQLLRQALFAPIAGMRLCLQEGGPVA
jgi:4-hydroxyphenylpyruvate dioxygenase-like putative hemolysin